MEELGTLEDIEGLMNIEEIKRMLFLAQEHQKTIDKKLGAILSQQEQIEGRTEFLELIP